MSSLTSAAVAVLLIVESRANAQNTPAIRQVEIGYDVAVPRSPRHDVLSRKNSPFSFRYGAVTNRHRFALDQRITLGDRRLQGSPDSWNLDTQLGWRIGSNKRVAESVMGPYVFGSFNLSSKANHFRAADAPNGMMVGNAGGIGTLFSAWGVTLRPELYAGYDPGSGVRGGTYWIPARPTFGFRFGTSLVFPIADNK